jgi:carbon storage regulator CsrA
MRAGFLSRASVAAPRRVAQNVPVVTVSSREGNDNQATRRSMLVLTRGVDEAIVVGDSIVRVVEIQEHTVRLGIASPHTTPRYREVTLRRDSEAESVLLELPAALTAG